MRVSIPVSAYMTSPVHTISSTEDVQEAERRMRAHGVSSLAVLAGKEHHLAGVISRTDILRAGRQRAAQIGGHALLKLAHESIGAVMHRDVIRVAPGDELTHAARMICERDVHRVYVAEGQRLVGVLSTKDLLRAVRDERIAAPLSAFMSAPVLTVNTEDPVSLATDRLAQEKVRGLVVVEGEWPVGLFTQAEALEAREEAAATPVEEYMSYAMLCLRVDTPLFRAAAQMAETRARRVIAVEERQVRGILTGMDLARALLK